MAGLVVAALAPASAPREAREEGKGQPAVEEKGGRRRQQERQRQRQRQEGQHRPSSPPSPARRRRRPGVPSGWRHPLAARRLQGLTRLEGQEWRRFSQNGEDGVLEVRYMYCTRRTCVLFGRSYRSRRVAGSSPFYRLTRMRTVTVSHLSLTLFTIYLHPSPSLHLSISPYLHISHQAIFGAIGTTRSPQRNPYDEEQETP